MKLRSFVYMLGTIIIASAEDLIIASGSGDAPLGEGSGESVITPDPIAQQGVPESPAVTMTVSDSLINNASGSLIVTTSEINRLHSEISENNLSIPAEAPVEVESTPPANINLESVYEKEGVKMWDMATEDPIFSSIQDGRQDVNQTFRVFRLQTIESYDLSAAENRGLVTVILNVSVPATEWIQDSAEKFSDVVTNYVSRESPTLRRFLFVAPSPYRTPTGLHVSFLFSSAALNTTIDDSCCLVAESLLDVLLKNKRSLEEELEIKIKEIFVGLPEEVLILGGLVRPLGWDNYTSVAASAVIIAAILSVLLGLAIACTRFRKPKEQENLYKETAYTIELGRNLASDEECKSTEYIINNKDDNVSRSISDRQQTADEEDCTWVVPIEEIYPAQGIEDIEDTKL